LLSDPELLIHTQHDLAVAIYGCENPSKSQMLWVSIALNKFLTPRPDLPVETNIDISGWRVVPRRAFGGKCIARGRPPDTSE
jgi:hypothetical protein